VLELGYQLAFWAQRRNQMALITPMAALQTLPPHIARLTGWCKPGAILNKQYPAPEHEHPDWHPP
jgi:hypothetical protein